MESIYGNVAEPPELRGIFLSVPKYRLDAIETIGRKILQKNDPALLDGPPQAVPIETIIETKFDLTLEYHYLRKNGSILGETIFDDLV